MGRSMLRPYMIFGGFEGVAYFWKQAEEKWPRKFCT
jgi:hypothetical protein